MSARAVMVKPRSIALGACRAIGLHGGLYRSPGDVSSAAVATVLFFLSSKWSSRASSLLTALEFEWENWLRLPPLGPAWGRFEAPLQVRVSGVEQCSLVAFSRWSAVEFEF